MVTLIALALLAQILSPNASTEPFQDDPAQQVLVMNNSRYVIDMGAGCDAFFPGEDVVFFGGSGGVGTLVATDGIGQCSIYIVRKLDDAHLEEE